MRSWSAVVVALLVAGCLGGRSDAPATGPASAEDGDTRTAPTVPAPLVLELPVWEVGLWWRYEVAHLGLGKSYTYDIVVTKADSSGYVLGASDEEGAYVALFTHYPTIGPVAPDLTHQIHGEGVSWFHFPMRPGDTWNAPYREFAITYAVTEVTVGDDTRALHVVGTHADGGPLIEYDWAPREGYFHALRFTREPDDTWDHEFRLRAYGNAYNGQAVGRTVADIVHAESTPPPVPGATASAAPGQFSVASGPTALLFGLFEGGGAGDRAVRFVSPSGALIELQGSTEDFGLTVARADPEPGTWNFLATAQDGFFFVEGYALYESEGSS